VISVSISRKLSFFFQTLLEEQLVLISTKASIEKSIADVESIRLQLEEVAKEKLLEEVRLFECSVANL